MLNNVKLPFKGQDFKVQLDADLSRPTWDQVMYMPIF